MTEWKILKNNVGGEERFQIYRIIDPNKPQHSGNMEFYDQKLYATREEALAVIAKMKVEV